MRRIGVSDPGFHGSSAAVVTSMAANERRDCPATVVKNPHVQGRSGDHQRRRRDLRIPRRIDRTGRQRQVRKPPVDCRRAVRDDDPCASADHEPGKAARPLDEAWTDQGHPQLRATGCVKRRDHARRRHRQPIVARDDDAIVGGQKPGHYRHGGCGRLPTHPRSVDDRDRAGVAREDAADGDGAAANVERGAEPGHRRHSPDDVRTERGVDGAIRQQVGQGRLGDRADGREVAGHEVAAGAVGLHRQHVAVHGREGRANDSAGHLRQRKDRRQGVGRRRHRGEGATYVERVAEAHGSLHRAVEHPVSDDRSAGSPLARRPAPRRPRMAASARRCRLRVRMTRDYSTRP